MLSWGESYAACIRGRAGANETQGWELSLSVSRRTSQILPKYRIVERLNYNSVSSELSALIESMGVKSLPWGEVVSMERNGSLCTGHVQCLSWWLFDS